MGSGGHGGGQVGVGVSLRAVELALEPGQPARRALGHGRAAPRHAEGGEEEPAPVALGRWIFGL